MAKFKVIALSVGGISGQIFKAGDIVGKDAFEDDATDALISGGFIAPYTGKDKALHEGSTEHVVTQDDIDRNPGSGLKLGETIYLPHDGFVVNDKTDQATNEKQLETGATHGDGKVLVPVSDAKAPITPAVDTTPEHVPEQPLTPGAIAAAAAGLTAVAKDQQNDKKKNK